MPKTPRNKGSKAAAAAPPSASDPSESDSDSGPNDVAPPNPPKRQKYAPKEGKKAQASDGPTWPLKKNRQVSVSEFRNNLYVNIREYFLASDGVLKPTKKGINLDMANWEMFKDLIPEIDEAIKKAKQA